MIPMTAAWRWVSRLSIWVKAGAVSGLVAGLAVGAMAPSPGLALGIALGLGVGAAAGSAMQKDERRREARDRELDEIIGVTSGALGMPPGSVRSPRPAPGEPDPIAARAWLTPPPPAIG